MSFKEAKKEIEVKKKVWNKIFITCTIFFCMFLIVPLYFIIGTIMLFEIKIIFIYGALFFLYFAFLADYLLCNKVGLKIDRFGLLILVNNPPVYIYLNHVTNISQKHKKYDLILIEVENPRIYISNEGSSYGRLIMKIKFLLFGTPFLINVDKLKINYDDLINIFENISNNQQFTFIIEF